MKPTLLIMAAGMGSRYGGVKQIDSVGVHGETLLDYGVYDAVEKCGFGKVVFIIRRDIEHDFRERLFDRIARNCDAEYVFQERTGLLTPQQVALSQERTKPWGTIHAILAAKDIVKTPFMVINSDDYYGRQAFGIMGDYLKDLPNDSTEHAMVGYFLKNTMSPVGTVSRGVCQVKDGMLQGMRENTKIEYDADGIVSHLPEGDVRMTGDEWVSMNLFGFAPSALDYMLGYWNRFITENAAEPKKECLLPNCVGEMVGNNSASLRVFTSPEKWFGMTYKEDRETVRQNLAEKTSQGVYPQQLWKN